jgi:hypothetical protein
MIAGSAQGCWNQAEDCYHHFLAAVCSLPALDVKCHCSQSALVYYVNGLIAALQAAKPREHPSMGVVLGPWSALCCAAHVVIGAANLDVIQEVEYVKEEDKLAYLLDCLQKTAPPVLVFAENKRDVDAIHEFLLVQVSRADRHLNRACDDILPGPHLSSHLFISLCHDALEAGCTPQGSQVGL